MPSNISMTEPRTDRAREIRSVRREVLQAFRRAGLPAPGRPRRAHRRGLLVLGAPRRAPDHDPAVLAVRGAVRHSSR